MDTCAREECDAKYVRKTHNQKYCSDECCRLATNSRIMEKYYQRRDQRNGVVRFCVVCETTKLSRYNESEICNACKLARTVNANNAVAEMLSKATLIA